MTGRYWMASIAVLGLWAGEGRAQLTELRVKATVVETVFVGDPVELDDVFLAYGASRTQPATLGAFLNQTAAYGSWNKSDLPLEIDEITSDWGTSSAGDDMEIMLVVADMGEDQADFTMYVDDGRFYIDVFVSGMDGYFSELMEFDLFAPVEPDSGELPPGTNDLYLSAIAAITCRCDTSGGGACSISDCDNLTTCPNINGTSCAHTSFVLSLKASETIAD